MCFDMRRWCALLALGVILPLPPPTPPSPPMMPRPPIIVPPVIFPRPPMVVPPMILPNVPSAPNTAPGFTLPTKPPDRPRCFFLSPDGVLSEMACP